MSRIPASLRRIVLIAGLALYIAGGLSRISFDVDILALLPRHLSQVAGLSLVLEHFSLPNELIVTVESDDAEKTEAAAKSLADALAASPDLVKRALAEGPWEKDPSGLGELLAFQLLSQPPEVFDALLERMAPANTSATLQSALEELTETLSPATAAIRSYDPFGFTDGLPSELLEQQQDGGGFASADGLFRVVYVESAQPLENYRDCIRWVDAIKSLTADWNTSHGVEIGFTGQPAFVADISGSMDREMSLTAGSALLLVGAIFWICYRRIRPLLVLLACVALTFALAMATAGWLLADLTVISVGFAAVMIGLSVDYGYYVFNRVAHGAASLPDLRKKCLSNIAWTSSTTAAVFLALSYSTLPGLSQLGVLVALGVVIGATVMLGVFAPFAFRHVTRFPLPSPLPIEHSLTSTRFLRWAGIFTAIGGIALVSVLVFKGPPSIDFSANTMRPRESGAYRAMERLSERLTDDSGVLNLVVTGDSYGEVESRLREADRQIADAVAHGDIASAMTATILWPSPERQRRNLEKAVPLSADIPRLREAVLGAGFTDQAFMLAESVLQRWKEWTPGQVPIWPSSDAAAWILRRLVRHDNGQLLAAGLVHPVPGHEEALLDSVGGPGIHLVGWDQLGRELRREIPGELTVMIGAIFAAVVIILLIAMRSPRAVLFFVATQAFSLACLAGATALLGGTVGLFSLAALLLLLGTGSGYAILPLLALRRNGGNARAAQGELALVIALCAASSVAGFGALGFANNLALAELGKTCALGLTIAACVSLFVLPPAWEWFARIMHFRR